MRSSINISLPQPLKAWLTKQVARSGFSTASEYVRHLLRAEQERKSREHIEKSLHQALESGEATPMTKDDWEDIRSEGRKQLKKRRRK
jgi:antitoxin ParD1/3/4